MYPVYSLLSYKPMKSGSVKKNCVFKINRFDPKYFFQAVT